MRIAYLDCFSGMSGDMFLGALIDAGVSPEVLEKAVAALDMGARLEISRVNRSGITATKVDVLVDGEKELPREEFWQRQEAHRHSQEHGVSHVHDSSHSHVHHSPGMADADPADQSASSRAGAPALHLHSHSHSHGRGLREIQEDHC